MYFFTTLLPIAQVNTEHNKKRYLTSDVAKDFIECMNNKTSPLLPSSFEDLVHKVNSKLWSTIDAIAPVSMKKATFKQIN